MLFELSRHVLSPAARGSSWNRSSIIVPMVLIVTCALMVMHGLAIGTPYLRGLALPSPVIGLAYAIAGSVLGQAEGISTGMAMEMAAEVT